MQWQPDEEHMHAARSLGGKCKAAMDWCLPKGGDGTDNLKNNIENNTMEEDVDPQVAIGSRRGDAECLVPDRHRKNGP